MGRVPNRLARADVAPEGVGPPGAVEAAVQEAKFARLRPQKHFEREASAPETDKKVG